MRRLSGAGGAVRDELGHRGALARQRGGQLRLGGEARLERGAARPVQAAVGKRGQVRLVLRREMFECGSVIRPLSSETPAACPRIPASVH